jgi:putative glutamine amidotransferase
MTTMSDFEFDSGEARADERMRPRIGITMRVELETQRFYLARFYSEAVEAAGGLPIHIPLIPRADYLKALMANLDGLLLPGSDSDVDPARYGHEPHLNLGYVHPERDETDYLTLAEAERLRMPVFAICFGLQFLNVFRGGTLIQDIRSQLPQAIKHEQGAPRDRHSHRVELANDSLLTELAGAATAPTNSHHHQAIDTLGRELVATAWTSDGLIEAVEDPRTDRFVIGVQWHPELAWERDELSRALFNRFVVESQQFADARHSISAMSAVEV